MADGFKILGTKELPPVSGPPYANTSDSLIYQVPSPSGERFGTRGNSQAIISTIVVCHHGGGNTAYTIRVLESSDAKSDPVTFDVSQYIIYHRSIGANETDVLTFGIGLTSGDAIYASADATGSPTSSNTNIHIFGTEVL